MLYQTFHTYENKDKLKGIFLTHGHEHAIGAVSYVLEQLDAPVYGSKLTIALIKENMKARNIDKKFATTQLIMIQL